MKKFFKLILTVLLLISVAFSGNLTAFAGEQTTATVLFTHDLHSHLLPSPNDNSVGEYGGYARLATAINEAKQKYPNAILVDGGDYSMGSLFQTVFASSAIELRVMGALGYDVTTFGNHEFDYRQSGLAASLNSAVLSGDALPQIVNSNYLLPAGSENSELKAAFDNYGVKEYTIIERGGIYFVVFGIFGIDSNDCAPNSGMVLLNSVTTANSVVEKATAECKSKYNADPVVICLSHSGTENGRGEDYDLAKNTSGIDIIVSAHSHTALSQPIKVNDTYIVSSGNYGKNLGIINVTLSNGTVSLNDYSLVPINETVASNPQISELIDNFKNEVEQNYLSNYFLTFDQVLAQNPYDFDTVDEVYATAHESTLGNIFSDAYKWSVEKALNQEVDVALTAAGVIRGTLPKGNITVSDVFNAASLGVGTEGELVKVYITGKDLKNALEVDASVQPLMNTAQLFFSGIEYSFNQNRMIFNKIDYAALRKSDGTIQKIENDKLYSVVTGMYCGQMLGSVEKTSFGLLKITPRNENGNEIASEDLINYVVKDENGNTLKEWYAIASYLSQMGGTVDSAYCAPDGRKVVYSSINPINLFKNANIFTYALIAVILIVVLVIFLITKAVIRRIKRKKVSV